MIASQTERCCEARGFLHVLHFYTANNQNKNAEATTAERWARFRYTLQNPSVADLDFSPISNEKTTRSQPCEWAKNRIIGHEFGGEVGLGADKLQSSSADFSVFRSSVADRNKTPKLPQPTRVREL